MSSGHAQRFVMFIQRQENLIWALYCSGLQVLWRHPSVSKSTPSLYIPSLNLNKDQAMDQSESAKMIRFLS